MQASGAHWFDRGSSAIELQLGVGHAGGYAAPWRRRRHSRDIALVSHGVGAGSGSERTLPPRPGLAALTARCLALDAFARAHPLAQPGAPASVG